MAGTDVERDWILQRFNSASIHETLTMQVTINSTSSHSSICFYHQFCTVRVSIKQATQLGPALDGVSDRCEELSRAVDKLWWIGSQESLLLLRASFSAPMLCVVLRRLFRIQLCNSDILITETETKTRMIDFSFTEN